jgi:hypothetical protein
MKREGISPRRLRGDRVLRYWLRHDEAMKAKIFDPFLGTKFPGRDFGLAVVQGIVRDLGGAINIVSTPGQGTTFQVLLPYAAARASEIQAKITSGAYPGLRVNHFIRKPFRLNDLVRMFRTALYAKAS